MEWGVKGESHNKVNEADSDLLSSEEERLDSCILYAGRHFGLTRAWVACARPSRIALGPQVSAAWPATGATRASGSPAAKSRNAQIVRFPADPGGLRRAGRSSTSSVRELTGSPNQTDPPYAERRLTYSSSKKEYERTSTKAKPQRDSPAETYFNRPASLTGA